MLDDILDFLEDEGHVSGSSGWVGVAGDEPPSPDACITVRETGGPPPEQPPEGSSETMQDQVTFQVRGRGEKEGYELLRTKMGDIYGSLHGGDLGTDFLEVRATQGAPFYIGRDNSDRPLMTWNYEARRERSASD